MRRLLRALLAAALLHAPLALAPLGCAESRHGAKNLILISVDSLRPDRLGYSGHDRPTSPTLDRLAAEGRVFANAYSPAGWTLPSMASVLTGRHPREHGATNYFLRLEDGAPTLASILRCHGYDTRAYVSHLLVGAQYGLGMGFRTFDETIPHTSNPARVKTGERLTDVVLRGLEAHPIRAPFFLWVHYFDPHIRYLAHADWSSFGDEDRDRYDQEIAHTDRQIARLLDALRQRDLYDDAVVIFTADHGEEFSEHGGEWHETLHEEVLRVPLVIRAPLLEPGPDTSLARHIDLLPTALALLGIQAPEGLPGRSLLEEPRGEPLLFFARDLPLRFRQRGVRRGDQKLLVIDAVELGDRAAPESALLPVLRRELPIRPGVFLYDLARDPGETRNLYAEHAPVARELMALLREHFGEDVAADNRVEVDAAMERSLRLLGYIR